MNADEIKKADEIVRELRAECVDCSEKDCCDHGNNPVKYCPVVDAADLIKQLQIELGNAGTICHICHLRSENADLKNKLTESQHREKAAVECNT